MNEKRNVMIISLVLILCIIISVLGAASLYGTLTRVEPQPVIVNGNHYQNGEIAGFVVLVDMGYNNLKLLPQAPMQAIPQLFTAFQKFLWNQLILVSWVTACAVFGGIFCIILLVIEIRKKPDGAAG